MANARLADTFGIPKLNKKYFAEWVSYAEALLNVITDAPQLRCRMNGQLRIPKQGELLRCLYPQKSYVFCVIRPQPKRYETLVLLCSTMPSCMIWHLLKVQMCMEMQNLRHEVQQRGITFPEAVYSFMILHSLGSSWESIATQIAVLPTAQLTVAHVTAVVQKEADHRSASCIGKGESSQTSSQNAVERERSFGRRWHCKRSRAPRARETPSARVFLAAASMSSNSSLSTMQRLVEQLKLEAGVERIRVSQAAAELQQYCMQNACKDALLVGVPAGSNPFREPRSCALL